TRDSRPTGPSGPAAARRTTSPGSIPSRDGTSSRFAAASRSSTSASTWSSTVSARNGPAPSGLDKARERSGRGILHLADEGRPPELPRRHAVAVSRVVVLAKALTRDHLGQAAGHRLGLGGVAESLQAERHEPCRVHPARPSPVAVTAPPLLPVADARIVERHRGGRDPTPEAGAQA